MNMADIKIHALQCGTVGTDETVPDKSRSRNPFAYTGVMRGERHRVWLPVYCYLIEHPAGRLLIDTGWHTDVRSNQRKALSWKLNVASKAKLPRGEAVDEQLDRLGLSPCDIDMVFLTHLDVDHVSGIKLMEGTPRFCVSKEELDAAIHGGLRYNACLWEGIDFEALEMQDIGIGPSGRGMDVFGDGSVRLVGLEGHSAGMTGLLLSGADGFVVITGDACYNRRSWEDLRLPGITIDETKAKSALEWVQKMSRDPRCIEILATHDPAVKPHIISLPIDNQEA